MDFKEKFSTIKKHLLTGTSHMIPFIVAGGILFSLAVMLNPEGAATPETGWLGDLASFKIHFYYTSNPSHNNLYTSAFLLFNN